MYSDLSAEQKNRKRKGNSIDCGIEKNARYKAGPLSCVGAGVAGNFFLFLFLFVYFGRMVCSHFLLLPGIV